MGPLVYHLTGVERSWRRTLAGIATVLGYGVIFALTESLSSQLALLAGGATWLVARFWPRAVRRLLSATWISAIVLIVPVSLALQAAGLQYAQRLPASARERVVIWGATATKILSAPVLGIGANASRATEGREDNSASVERTPLGRSSFPHPHNAYLQIWYELGLPGAALLLGFGLVILWRISQMSEAVQPFAYGQFSVTAALIASSYGLWQHWLLSAITLGVIALMLVDIVATRRLDKAVTMQ
jgi:O-antigen ligase